MKCIMLRVLKDNLKNPIYYAGAILVIAFLYQTLYPYLNIVRYETEAGLSVAYKESADPSDADIMEGYIPTTQAEQEQIGWQHVYSNLTEGLGKSETEAKEIILDLKDKDMSLDELAQYMKKNYGYHNIVYEFSEKARKATIEEMQSFIDQSLHQETYTAYFARKFVDRLSVAITFYGIIILAFLYIYDTKSDMYELLHTKSIRPFEYILGKMLGGFIAVMLVVSMITLLINIIAMLHGISSNFPVNFADMWMAVLLFIVPGMITIIAVYTAVSILFKTPIPAIPMLILYVFYSNMGSSLESTATYGYAIKPLALLVRFPEIFFGTSIGGATYFAQVQIIGLSIILTMLSIIMWKRRVY
ncbi:hypothetical protein LQZ18_14000 [Lachnospiraceae bacterium ZAX-1]